MTAMLDNPETQRREIWRYGTLVGSITARYLIELHHEETPPPAEPAPGVVNFDVRRPWKGGAVVGDPMHIAESWAHAVTTTTA